jgi:RNA polymerase sigma-70 factor (ECF subfamily)
MDTTRPSLLLRIRDRGDAVAWHTFDSLYRPMLERFARARGLDAAEAEDVAQHCLTQVCDRIGEFNYDPARGRFKSWLRTLVNNHVRNLLRNRHEQGGHSADLLAEPAREAAPDEVFDRIWQEQHLWYCLRELRAEVEETTFLAFQYYVLEQRPIEEVCRTLGVTAGNVHTIKWRLTQQVAGKMKELLDDVE